MITTNINTTPPNYEEEINSFYLTQLDRTYDEGVVLSNSSSIGCRPLAFAIKAGTKILINGISLEIYSDAAQSAVEFFITATTLTESINKGAKITIDKENLFLQYQRKTEGQVAGFDIDADGISKGGVEITGWLDSDTMEGATANNLPTAESVKAYVDAQVGASDTLAEVLSNGNTTSGNDMIFTDSDELKIGTASDLRLYHNGSDSYIRNYTGTLHIDNEASGQSLIFKTVATERMRITSSGNVLIGTTSDDGAKLDVAGDTNASIFLGKARFQSHVSDYMYLSHYDKGSSSNYALNQSPAGSTSLNAPTGQNVVLRINNSAKLFVSGTNGNVGIGTTAPSEKLEVAGVIKLPFHSNNSYYLSQDNGTFGYGKMRPFNNSGFYTFDTYYLYNGGYKFLYNGTEQMRITSAGNVGIGTTAPTEKLHVVGDALITGGLEVNAANIDFRGLGTSDPGVVGRLWQDSGILKISEG